MKELKDLINTQEPGWDLVKEWIKEAKVPVEVLPKDNKRAEQELLHAQVSTRSPMGAIIYETGGILVNNGWIRILGSGGEKLNRGLMEWNKGKTFENYGEQQSFMLVADDAIGGYFAINAGEFGDDIGKVYFLMPHGIQFFSLGLGYSEFLVWIFSGQYQSFYDIYKWKTCKEDIQQLRGDQTLSFVPFLFMDSLTSDSIEKRSKVPVPTDENYYLRMDISNQLLAGEEFEDEDDEDEEE